MRCNPETLARMRALVAREGSFDAQMELAAIFAAWCVEIVHDLSELEASMPGKAPAVRSGWGGEDLDPTPHLDANCDARGLPGGVEGTWFMDEAPESPEKDAAWAARGVL